MKQIIKMDNSSLKLALLLFIGFVFLFPRQTFAEEIRQNENYIYCYNEKYDGIEIINYHGTEGIVTVPKEIDGVEVKVIGKEAFGSRRDIISEIILPDSVIVIKERAFFVCINMKKIILPEKLKELGENALGGTESLRTLELPQSLTELSSGVLYGAGLESISIPQNIKSIESSAFFGCSNLEKVKFAKNSKIKKIGYEAFAQCAIKELIFPDSLKVIEENAFDYNKELRKVIFGKKSKLKDLKSCFYKCSSLERVVIPKSLKRLRSFTFSNCKKLHEITFLGDAPKIDEKTFHKINKKAVFKVPSKYKTKYKKALTKETGFLKKTMRICAV